MMRGLSLADALKDFGAGPPRSAHAFAAGAMPGTVEDLADFPPMAMAMPEPEPVDIDALVAREVAEAVAAAEQALREQLVQEHAEALSAEKELHAEEIARLQQRFAQEAAAKIDAGFAEMETRLAESTGMVASRILGALLSDDLRDRSIARLADLIREALRDGEAVRIRVHGNLPLFETLKQQLPGHAGQFDFMESPDFDLSVAIDESIYETRLAEWSAALAEILA